MTAHLPHQQKAADLLVLAQTQLGSGSRLEAVQQLTAALAADEIARTGERS